MALVLVPAFAVIVSFPRALPTWVFLRGTVSSVEARALAVRSAVGLSIIVITTSLGVSEHRMKPQKRPHLPSPALSPSSSIPSQRCV